MRAFESWNKTALRAALENRGWRRVDYPQPSPWFSRRGAQHRNWARGKYRCSMRNAAIKEHLVAR